MNRLYLLASLLVFPFIAKTQFVDYVEKVYDQEVSFQYGFTYSYLESKVCATQSIYTRPESGYSLSLQYEHIYRRYFSVETGLSYLKLNYNLSYESKVEYKVQLDNINIPLLFKYNSDLSNFINYSLFAGPQIGGNLHSDVSYKFYNDTQDTINRVLSLAPATFGLSYGASAEFTFNKAKTLKFVISGKGNYDLTKATASVNEKTFEKNIIPDETRMISYGIYFGLKAPIFY